MFRAKVVDKSVVFFCVGCNLEHAVNIDVTKNPKWVFNFNLNTPTLKPSVDIKSCNPDLSPELEEEYDRISVLPNGRNLVLNDPRFRTVCHSFIENGKIRYLPDCTHSYAGQTVELPAKY
jgi:hypothetical protein